MEYLDGKNHVNISGLKFDCRYCQAEVVVRYLTAGEEVVCQNCGKTNVVPGTAISSDDPPSVLEARLRSPRFPNRQPKLTLADRIKRKYRRIEFWIGLIVSIFSIVLLESYVRNVVLRFIVSILIGLMVSFTISNLRKEEEESTPRSKLENTETGHESQVL